MTKKNQQSEPLEALSDEILAADPTETEAIDRLTTILYKRGAMQGPNPPHAAEMLTSAADILAAIRDKRSENPELDIHAVVEAVASVAAASTDPDGNETPRIRSARMRSARANLQASTSAGDKNPAPELQDITESAALESSPEMIREHAEICLERLDTAEQSLLDMEIDDPDKQHLHNTLRQFHTIKGSSAMLGLTAMMQLAHQGEEILSLIEKGKRPLNTTDTDVILKTCDFIRNLAKCLLAGNLPDELPTAGLEELQAQLVDAANCDLNPSSAEMQESTATSLLAELCETSTSNTNTKTNTDTKNTEPTTRVPISRLDSLIDMVSQLLLAQSIAAKNDSVQIPEPFYRRGKRLSNKVKHQKHSLRNAPKNEKKVDRKLANDIDRIGSIAQRLRDLSLSLRMGTLEAPFKRAARLVRDLSRKSAKPVKFIAQGQDTQIDRSMVEYLTDPLVHLLRNAIDHGIESPELRRQRGKDDLATITLKASHSAGNVIIKLTDDGCGLDRDRILQVATQRGLIEPDSDELTDSEVFDLIFQPGFSTAPKVTNISGRGVGLDVVCSNIEKIQGRVEVSSSPGIGTTFKIILPLTTAMIEAASIHVGNEKYLLPNHAIERCLKLSTDQRVTNPNQSESVIINGENIPLVHLEQLLGLTPTETDPAHMQIIILRQARGTCSLVIDDCTPGKQVIVKPISHFLETIKIISGSSIDDDGNVVLILDPSEIIAAANSLAKDDTTAA